MAHVRESALVRVLFPHCPLHPRAGLDSFRLARVSADVIARKRMSVAPLWEPGSKAKKFSRNRRVIPQTATNNDSTGIHFMGSDIALRLLFATMANRGIDLEHSSQSFAKVRERETETETRETETETRANIAFRVGVRHTISFTTKR